MSMSFGLATTLNNSQKLTPQMQQAIKLLQLSSLELAQEVQMKLDSNPLLERIENDEYDDDDFEDDNEEYDSETESRESVDDCLTLEMWNSDDTDDLHGARINSSSSENHADTDYHYADDDSSFDGNGFDDSSDSFDKLQQANIDGNAMDVDSQNYDSNDYDSFNTDGFSASSLSHASQTAASSANFDDFDSYQGATSATIQDHVRWQLNFKRLSDIDILIADYLIDSMDEMGFIRLDIDELLQSFATMSSFYQWDEQIEREEIVAVLRAIQSCDPLGVGACNLSECLAIQLNKLDPNTQHLKIAQALLSASEHLVSNNIKALTQATGLQPEQITPALMLLRSLNPSPGLVFQGSQPEYTQPPESYDIPDVIVTPIRHHATEQTKANHTASDKVAQDSRWQVSLNPETLPRLQVNKEYANLVKRGDNSSDNQYLRDNLIDARLFIRSIEERNQNLLKVATSIVRRQQEFLRHGAAAMQPLILKDIAEEVDLHESTVSRLTTSKSILTPQGLFSLKHFFSSHVSGSDGDVSSTAISAMIKQFISEENPKKPLSDSQLQAHLLSDGIDIARRTVAKYREAMNIGSSTQRKQKY